MSTFEMIAFLVIFAGMVFFSCRDIVKTEDEIEKKKNDRRQQLEAENTEYDYGHNISHKRNEE